jgi:hypothetical protein
MASVSVSVSEPKIFFQVIDARRRVLAPFGHKNMHSATPGFMAVIV